MAAYAAVISLKHTINSLLNSSRISLASSTREILQSAYDETISLQQVLEGSNDKSRSKTSRERLDALEGQIRDCAHKLEDVLEFHELSSLKEEYEDQEVREEITTSFSETVKKLKKDYIEELYSPMRYNDDDDKDNDNDDYDEAAAIVSSSSDAGVDMVRNSNPFIIIRDSLLRRMRPNDTYFYSFLGESGSGKTMAAKTIFEDLREQNFDCCAWVTTTEGAEPKKVKEVLICILVQVYIPSWRYYEYLTSREDEKLCEYLNIVLENRRYMIVLDDVRDAEVVLHLRRSLPDQSNGSLVILTTSVEQVARLADRRPYRFEVPEPHFTETFWLYISVVNFGSKLIPREFKEAGDEIIKNCRGLSISAAKVLLFLNKTDNSVRQWRKLAADKSNPIFIVGDEISEISAIEAEIHNYNWDMDDAKRRDIAEFISKWLYFPVFVADIKREMHPERFFSKMQIISLFGMAGIGKSILSRKIINDDSILRHFDHHVWVTLGPEYETGEILIDILAQIYPDIDRMHIKGDEKLAKELCVRLAFERCLIVLDDLWSKEPLDLLKNLFPDIKGTTIVTTRLVKVAKFGIDDFDIEMQFLDEEESWCLLSQKVFGDGFCPIELEKVGRMIAEKCDGLPLLILRVAEQLLKVEISQENWNDIALGKEKLVFMNAHHQITEALLPSYHSLPQHLKACFLYIGIFREKYEIHMSMLTNMWIAEGFLQPNSSQMVEDFVAECLSDLVDRSLVLQLKISADMKIEICRHHAVFWHLSNTEAVKNRFFYAMNSYDDCSIENMMSQRRLCIRNSILLGMKDVQNSMSSSCTSTHSLLCVSPFQQYPVPLNFEMRLLRVMNALVIRLYEFPVEVVRQVHLRYLGVTCNGELPTSISNIWKLQYLIVMQYMNIQLCDRRSSPLPVEIWNMKELKHLQIMDGHLPNPTRGAYLLKLSTLIDVSVQSCTKEVLEMIPNLKRLGIRIISPPDDEGNSFHYLNNISRLDGLESLKCVVVNPQIRHELVAPLAPIAVFPSSLKKLSLSGLGYPWKYMSIIGKLENLEVLKLKGYAFQGPKWEMDYGFKKLKFLSIQDTNLVQWKVNKPITTKLEHLCIKHCYKLRELPTFFPFRSDTSIEIVDCNPATVTWAEQMLEALTARQAIVHLSWIDGTHKE